MTTVRQAGLLFLLAGLGAATLAGHCKAVAAQTTSSQRVTIYFTARDSRGKIVSDLAENEVRLSADGKPQKIEQFLNPAQAPPLTVGLLFDVSGSMADSRVPDARRLFLNFFQEVISPGSQGFVAEFSQTTHVLGAISDDPVYLSTVASETTHPHGHSALNDAIEWTFTNVVGNHAARIALVLWTHGVDITSHASVKTIEEDAARLNATVCSVEFTDPPGVEDAREADMQGHGLLRELARATGGVTEALTEDEDLQSAMTRIAEGLRNTYTISFSPNPLNADDRFHKLKVKIERRGVRVFARDGYYAPKN